METLQTLVRPLRRTDMFLPVMQHSKEEALRIRLHTLPPTLPQPDLRILRDIQLRRKSSRHSHDRQSRTDGRPNAETTLRAGLVLPAREASAELLTRRCELRSRPTLLAGVFRHSWIVRFGRNRLGLSCADWRFWMFRVFGVRMLCILCHLCSPRGIIYFLRARAGLFLAGMPVRSGWGQLAGWPRLTLTL